MKKVILSLLVCLLFLPSCVSVCKQSPCPPEDVIVIVWPYMIPVRIKEGQFNTPDGYYTTEEWKELHPDSQFYNNVPNEEQDNEYLRKSTASD